MGNGIDIYPPSLRAAGKSIGDAAQRLSDQWSALNTQADSMGDIFGDDMVGGLIGASYAGAQEVADESFTSAVEGLGEAADGLDAMADIYDNTEQDNTAGISQQVS